LALVRDARWHRLDGRLVASRLKGFGFLAIVIAYLPSSIKRFRAVR